MAPSRTDSIVTLVALAAVLTVAAATGAYAVFFEGLDPDEFQHVHLAWEVAQGKVLYQGFFDNHGPLFTLVNSVGFSLLGLEPGASAFSWLRLLSLAYMCAIGVLLFQIGKSFTGDRRLALIGVAVFATLEIVLDKGLEIRPDTLQNLLWVGAFALLVRDPQARSVRTQGSAGMLLGLAIACNTKAGICLVAVMLFFCSELLVSTSRRRLLRSYLSFALGVATVFTSIAIGFAAWGAVYELGRYTLVFPFHMLVNHGEEGYFLGDQLRHYLFEQGLFSGLALTGTFLLMREVWRDRTDSRRRLLLIVPLTVSLAIFTGTYDQTMLMCLPLAALLAAYPLVRLFTRFPRWPARLLMIAVVFVPQSELQIRHARSSSDLRQSQDQLTEKMLQLTTRDEAVGFLWSDCGGYAFNDLSQWRWMGNYMVWVSLNSLEGDSANPQSYGRQFLDSLEQQQVRYFIAKDYSLIPFTAAERGELHDRFELNDCLWSRRGWTERPEPG